jgi:bacterioferritin
VAIRENGSRVRMGALSMGVSREQLIDLLNEDLAREYQAVIAYVVYSQVIKGAEFMNIAAELELQAHEELQHG